MTRISRRNSKLLLQYPANGPRNTIGRKEVSWFDYSSPWVAVRRVSGGEASDGDQTESFGLYEIKMLYVDCPTLTNSWRFRQGSSEPFSYYHIVSVDADEWNKEWTIVASLDEKAKVTAETIEP